VETKKLTLDIAVDLREQLDREIHENYQILVSQNSVDTKTKNKIDIRELLRKIDLQEIQVIRLKEAIQLANLKRHTKEKNSNSYYIYRRSQLLTKRDSLLKMSTNNGKIGKKTFTITIDKEEVEKILRIIYDEIDKVTQKLSKFNTSKKNEIKVQFEEELLYLLK